MTRYVGLSDDKLPHGWGEMDYQTGSSYSGHWAQGMRDGCGVMVSPGTLSTRFTGQWQRDRMTGWGEMRYSNGAVYRGQWVDNMYHGRGELTWASGDAYAGAWSMGLMHGRGEYTYSDGARWGERGVGERYHDFTSRYEGQWSNGLSTGDGLMKTATGVCLDIIWEMQQPISYIAKC